MKERILARKSNCNELVQNYNDLMKKSFILV